MARLTAGAYAPEWKARAIGEIFLIRDDLPGQAPPDAVAGMRFIKLTAGENGAGQYNDGALINETVTGTAPLVTATAQIAAIGSALDGQVVNLLNSEGRYLKPGAAAGTLANDQMQQITGQHKATREVYTSNSLEGALTYAPGGGSAGVGAGSTSTNTMNFDSAASPGARTGTHTDVKHAQATAYMRVL